MKILYTLYFILLNTLYFSTRTEPTTTFFQMTFQVFDIYRQAWGIEQARLRKQEFYKKSSDTLCHILEYRWEHQRLLQPRPWETPRQRSRRWKDFMVTLLQDCLKNRLPMYHSYPKRCTPVVVQYYRRIFFPKHHRPNKNQLLHIRSLRRVDAILCLF